MNDDAADGPAALRFASLMRRIHAALPGPVRRVVPKTFIGYALINGSAFLLDMAFLALISQFLTLPYGILFSVGYALASVYAFILNRWLNFREHGDLGKQTGKYVLVIVSNYLIWIVGFASLLDLAGLHIMVARVMTACCEGIYIYLMLRLWVFPRGRVDEGFVAPEGADSEASDAPGPPRGAGPR
ncbi:GtrA family protein [Propioniciclava soli]|uniref:GtrA family protein n=1 Tax=Propioniciclava soli TaxID=2775081 RepID=A0ABZ3CBH6_9ACTN